MPYRFAVEHQDLSDYSSGRVFYNQPGRPAFPVRLASEVFQRCMAARPAGSGPCLLYDPCCGSAYHLAVLGYFHGEDIRALIASDVDAQVLEVAARNLGLLSLPGLERRTAEIEDLLQIYGKESHRQALESAARLRTRLTALTALRPLSTRLFQADASDPAALARGLSEDCPDLVFTDVPYGQHSAWQSSQSDPLWAMLEALAPRLAEGALVAVAADKAQKPAHSRYHRLDVLRAGLRQVTLLRLLS